MLIWLWSLACTSSTIEISGVAKAPGNPNRFIQLCESNDATALALKEAIQGASCQDAGSKVANVSTINFSPSKLQKVNLATLNSLSNLEHVAAYGKEISDISDLAGLLRLEELYLMQNHIVDISPLQELNQLKYLRLDGNDIVDVSVIGSLKKLEKLGLDDNQISDFTVLAKLPALQDLNINFNPVDRSKCPMGDDVNRKLNKYCIKLNKEIEDMQGAIDPK